MIPVVDISKWQGKGNFKLLASLGVRGVIVRAGNGLTPDPMFNTYVTQAKAEGLATGAYWFCNPRVGTAEVQGRMLAEAHLMQSCELPPMLDVESFDRESMTLPHPSPGQFADWLEIMTAEVERTRRPFFYSNAAFWNPNVIGLLGADSPAERSAKIARYLNRYSFGDYDIIVARYPFYSPQQCAVHVPPLDARDWDEWIMAETAARPQVPIGWDTWDGWQFSAGYNGRGPVYGFQSSDLDLNIIRDDVWDRWLNTSPEPEPAPVVEEDEPMNVVTNATQQGTGPAGAPGKIKWLVTASGKLRHLSYTEWIARGSDEGVPLSDAQLFELGQV